MVYNCKRKTYYCAFSVRYYLTKRGRQAMSDSKSWENECCRCGSEVKVNLFPGKRACHVSCGPCTYPEDWGKCASCEIVGHCSYAVSYLKTLKTNGIKKGCYFKEQLTGEESLYHILQFVNANQQIIKNTGERTHLEELKKANAKSPCLQSRQ